MKPLDFNHASLKYAMAYLKNFNNFLKYQTKIKKFKQG